MARQCALCRLPLSKNATLTASDLTPYHSALAPFGLQGPNCSLPIGFSGGGRSWRSQTGDELPMLWRQVAIAEPHNPKTTGLDKHAFYQIDPRARWYDPGQLEAGSAEKIPEFFCSALLAARFD